MIMGRLDGQSKRNYLKMRLLARHFYISTHSCCFWDVTTEMRVQTVGPGPTNHSKKHKHENVEKYTLPDLSKH